MIDELLALPTNLRRALADALEVGVLPLPTSEGMLRSVLGSGVELVAATRCLERAHAEGVTARALCAWLRSVDRARRDVPRPELVWTGPEVVGLHARDTEAVFDSLVQDARHSLWISMYVYFDGPRAFGKLARRMDEVPELRVTLLLNLQRKRGDTTSAELLVRRFADRLWGADWPGARRPLVYFDPRSLAPEGPEGVLHAKAVVADEQSVFVTSANLTEAAQRRNVELGVLSRDPALALRTVRHLEALIEGRHLQPLPSE